MKCIFPLFPLEWSWECYGWPEPEHLGPGEGGAVLRIWAQGQQSGSAQYLHVLKHRGPCRSATVDWNPEAGRDWQQAQNPQTRLSLCPRGWPGAKPREAPHPDSSPSTWDMCHKQPTDILTPRESLPSYIHKSHLPIMPSSPKNFKRMVLFWWKFIGTCSFPSCLE